MNVTDFNLFPILIRYVENFLSEVQTQDIKNYCKSKQVYPHGLMNDFGKSSYDGHTNFLRKITESVPSCSNLESIVGNAVESMCKEIGLGSVGFTNSWFNIQTAGGKLDMHTHPMSVISGTLYINVDEHSSPFVIENPNTYLKFCGMWQGPETFYSAKFVSLQPTSGSLLLFPSYLNHGSNGIKNNTNERIAISFNTRH